MNMKQNYYEIAALILAGMIVGYFIIGV